MSKPIWLEIAESKLGQHEVKGGENPFIIECHACTTLAAKEDEIAWCSSFVNWCMKQAGLDYTKSAAAKSWIDYGQPLDELREGAIVVIQQKQAGQDQSTGSTSGFHVAFFAGQDEKHITLLGGNQSDSVKYSAFKKSSYDIKAIRWPEEVK